MKKKEAELNFDEVDLEDLPEDDELGGMDLSDFGEVDDTMELPHIKLATKPLKEVLKVAKLVCASGGRDIISKAVCFVCDEAGKVHVKMTDFDVYLDVSLERMNEQNVLGDPVVVPTEVLIKLIKAVPSNTIIFKDGDEYKIRLYGGDIPLETYAVDVQKFDFSEELVESGVIESKTFYSTLKDFSPIVTAAVAPQERRIVCDSEEAIAFYMWGIMISRSSYSDMDLKVKDISILKTLTVGTEDTLRVFDTAPEVKVKRKVIQSGTFKYSFLVSDAKVADQMKDSISAVATNDGVYVDFLQLYKLVEIASELPYAIGKVAFNYCEDGVELIIKTKKGNDSKFVLNGSEEGNTAPMKEEIVVQAKLLRVFLRAFANQSSVKLTLSSKGTGIQCQDYIAAIYPERK